VNELFGVEAERRDDGVGVVRLMGEVDMYTAPQLKQAMLGLIDGGAAKVVVDLSGVTFVDSTALGVLIGGVRRLHAAGGAMALVVVTRPVGRVLSITGLDRVFTIHKTLEDAVAALA
jgi:anti-sigma B factor antagonist